MALAELERLEELVAMRQAVAGTIDEVVRDCRWLVPQMTPEGCVHTFWSYAARLTDEGPDWAEFRRTFVELGGDGFYGAWLPVYREPVFLNLSEAVAQNPGRYPQFAACLPDYREVHCPVLERVQPRLIQFKTNYFDLGAARRQADILARAIRAFS